METNNPNLYVKPWDCLRFFYNLFFREDSFFWRERQEQGRAKGMLGTITAYSRYVCLVYSPIVGFHDNHGLLFTV